MLSCSRYLTASLVAWLVLFSIANAFGTLYVNNIVATTDTNNVAIEGIVIRDNNVALRTLIGSGSTTVEGVTFTQEAVEAFSLTALNVFIGGAATTNAFTQNNNPFGSLFGQTAISSSVSITGQLDIYNSLTTISDFTVNTGNFFVSTSGTIIGGTLQANGGIDIFNGLFGVHNADGSVVSSGGAAIANGIVLTGAGSSTISRFPTASSIGGDTIFGGQYASFVAGNLVLEPGYAVNTVSGTNGRIVIGTATAQPIDFGRKSLFENMLPGGFTIFGGQDAVNGKGGDAYVVAGDGLLYGGSVLLSQGAGYSDGIFGRIILGSLYQENYSPPVAIGRPPVSSTGNSQVAGSLYVRGQDSNYLEGGDLIFSAGNSTERQAGSIYIVPGQSTDLTGTPGSIYLGTSNNDFVGVGRVPLSATAGNSGGFTVRGQDSYGGNGGDLYLIAGTGNTGNIVAQAAGGVLYLSPGTSSGNAPAGNIIWGLNDHSLVVCGPQTAILQTGPFISVIGQQSQSGTGGDLNISAGNGPTAGGNLIITGGDSVVQYGDVKISAGFGQLLIQAGNADVSQSGFVQQTSGGDLIISGGFSTDLGTNGGDVNINAFVHYFSPSSSGVYVSESPFTIADSLVFQRQTPNGPDYLSVSPTPASLVSYNGNTLITQRPDELFLVLDVRSDVSENVSRLQDALLTLINALGPCGHGLIQYANPSGQVINSCLVPN